MYFLNISSFSTIPDEKFIQLQKKSILLTSFNAPPFQHLSGLLQIWGSGVGSDEWDPLQEDSVFK